MVNWSTKAVKTMKIQRNYVQVIRGKYSLNSITGSSSFLETSTQKKNVVSVCNVVRKHNDYKYKKWSDHCVRLPKTGWETSNRKTY